MMPTSPTTTFNSTTTASPPLRVLCLHDGHSNALSLKESIRKLGDRLCKNHGIDLVYVDAPLPSFHENEDEDDTSNGETSLTHASPLRIWWRKTSLSDPAISTIKSHVGDPRFMEENINPSYLTPQHASQTASDTFGRPSRDTVDPLCRIAMLPTSASIVDITPSDDALESVIGLDAALLLLQQTWKSWAPIGILGVGQGASMAALLNIFLRQPPELDNATFGGDAAAEEEVSIPTLKLMLPPPQFAIFINAHSLLTNYENHSLPIMQCLHLVTSSSMKREDDAFIRSMDTEARMLHDQMGGYWYKADQSGRGSIPTTSSAANDSVLKLTSHEANLIGKFLVEQKKRLLSRVPSNAQEQMQDNNDIENDLAITAATTSLVSLQLALHETEQEAAQLIAEQVALNPPKALMAIIQPSHVSGRSSDVVPVRPPGGGAPCPAEFLLQRNRRGTTTTDPTDPKSVEESPTT